ncbi:MAG: hypothetical protein CMQ34_09820 [Gammaproteobacteria bacterium]|nr:hypothetical protein [Gammaproteobacteria bacterium]|tara:strand:+ start:2280 stop:2483 length:204 start_codon:yes stop_codon:yes gene_type:complete
MPGIPNFLLSGGAGGLTVAPSSTATSGKVGNTLNFGSSAGGAGGMSTPNLLIVGGVVLAAVYLMGRK